MHPRRGDLRVAAEGLLTCMPTKACLKGLLFHTEKIQDRFADYRAQQQRISEQRKVAAGLEHFHNNGGEVWVEAQNGTVITEPAQSGDELVFYTPNLWGKGIFGVTLTTGVCAASGTFHGAFVQGALETERLGVDLPDYSGSYPPPGDYVDFVASDACGNYYLIRHFEGFDFAPVFCPFSVTHLQPGELSFILGSARFRTEMLMDLWAYEAAQGRKKLSRVMGELDAMRDQLRNIALSIGRSYNTLHNYYDHCLGVFDKEGWYAFTDTLASNLLLIVGSAGLNTWAAGARTAALTPGRAAGLVKFRARDVSSAARGTGRLTSIGNGQWRSGAGLVYGQGSVHGNRVKHVLAHAAADASKPAHSVFNVARNRVLGLVDEAWAARGSHTIHPSSGNWNYRVDMGRVIGTEGQTAINISVRPGTSEIITAFPVP